MTDPNEFFRNATMRICGSLEIEETLRGTVEYLNSFIPVDRICLQVYEPHLMAIRTLATATEDILDRVDFLFPLPEEVRKRILEHGIQPESETVVIDTVERNPMAKEMLRMHGIEDSSILRMNLMTEEGRYGGVILTALGEDRHTEEHARLLQLLEEPFTIALANILAHRDVLKLKELLADDNRFLAGELRRLSGDEIVGAEFGLRGVMDQVQRVARTDSPVLLMGETGVGKDLVANAIHLGSSRCDGPFIPVNCGAIPESLLDSELFGHEKGAFTGALSKKRGRFERANLGTIFLDEIGEMPLQAQVRLLRVLQNREIERIGGTRSILLDTRIIAATNKDLEREVQEGRFREDLWFRLNVFPIRIPPLRDRTGDIPALVRYFLEQKARELKVGATPTLADGAIDALMSYDWPGNVRELANVVERAMIIHRDEPLRFDDLSGGPSLPAKPELVAADGHALELDTVAAQHIQHVLNITGGKIHGPGGAGEFLGVNPSTLRSKIRKLGITVRKN
ncbi:MAG: sigma-54-dependent Fis family transcriptional regulator [Deltaproteobacteria bacterium]|nr:sigma-54-dependent Fis family transcriptional regulator [Deltaproteobacteria bacterium]